MSTQVTTRSDQLAAAGAAQAAVMRPQRYAGLTPMQYLDSADLDMLLAETRPGDRLHPKRHKQVSYVKCKTELQFCSTFFFCFLSSCWDIKVLDGYAYNNSWLILFFC